MSIRMNPGTSRLTVLGKGWNDNTVIDSGDGFTVDGEIWGGDDEIWWDGDDVPQDPGGDNAFRFTVNSGFDYAVYFSYQGKITVDWGDGKISDGPPPSEAAGPMVNSYFIASHYYNEKNTEYTISITGDLQSIIFSPIQVLGQDLEHYKKVTSVLTPFPETMRDVVDLSGLFFRSGLLTSIPAGLFDNCPNVTSFASAFDECRLLASIPAGLFDNCPKVTDFGSVFRDCKELTSIPAGLFDNCPKVTSFASAFRGCNSLTSIPAGLFDNCPNVTSFEATFYLCNSLTSIPAGLFDNCPNVTDFSYTFEACMLTSIPTDLFAPCPRVTSFYCTFYYCWTITGDLPELWNTHPDANGCACFRDCDHAANYESVPERWR